MPTVEEIREVCDRLIACEDDVEIRRLAVELQRLTHEFIEETRGHMRVFPLLNAAPKRKKVA